MNVLIAILALCLAGLVQSFTVKYYDEDNAKYSPQENAEWEQFKTTFSKTYNTHEEEKNRKDIFLERLKTIQEHNEKYKSGEVSYSMVINQFADKKPSEIPKGLKPILSKEAFRDIEYHQAPPGAKIPDHVDWRTKGVVTPVKDQLNCGSCWAFSATGALEGQLALKYKKLVSLSEQNLVDCDKDDHGCDFPGGDPWDAFDYISKHGGLDSEESYPYEGKDGKCRFNVSSVAVKEKGWVQVKPNEEALKVAVATAGPISVCIDASPLDFYFTGQGVLKITDCSSDSTRSDHCVLVIGYGTTDKGEDYWLVKNSWGGTWGDKGVGKMARNFNNMCGIATTATYPIVFK